MTANRNRWLVGTVLTLALAAFLSLSLLPILGSNSNRRGSDAASTSPPADPTSMQAELEAQARGYELVLEREPDNQTALQGLVDARIQLGDISGVVSPLEKLVELNPGVADYAVLLAQATALAPAQFKDQIELMATNGQGTPEAGAPASGDTVELLEPAPAGSPGVATPGTGSP